MHKKECFASNGGVCCILVGQTSCSNCKFYKTEAQLKKEQNAAKKRLAKINALY